MKIATESDARICRDDGTTTNVAAAAILVAAINKNNNPGFHIGRNVLKIISSDVKDF